MFIQLQGVWVCQKVLYQSCAPHRKGLSRISLPNFVTTPKHGLPVFRYQFD